MFNNQRQQIQPNRNHSGQTKQPTVIINNPLDTEDDEEDSDHSEEDEKDDNKNPPNQLPQSEQSIMPKDRTYRKAPSLLMNMVDQAVKEQINNTIKEECDSIFESHVQVYLYEIGIYSILGDTIDSLNVLNLSSSTQSLINYLLAKLLLFYANRLVNSLVKKQDILKLHRFAEFVETAPSKLIIGKINNDIKQWSMKFSLFYYGIDLEQDIQSEEVRKIVTEEVTETDFDSQLKIPTRLVLDLVFKASYKMGRLCQSQLQSSSILRTTLYILLSMLINNVFDATRVKDYLYYYFKDQKNNNQSLDFIQFSLWTAQAPKETLLNQIHHLIKMVFGEQKLLILKSRVQ